MPELNRASGAWKGSTLSVKYSQLLNEILTPARDKEKPGQKVLHQPFHSSLILLSLGTFTPEGVMLARLTALVNTFFCTKE